MSSNHTVSAPILPVEQAALSSDNDPSSPVIDVPGAYPEFSSSTTTTTTTTTTNEWQAGAKDSIHHTAEAYIAPERLDQVEHLVEGVGHKAAQYVPAGVASAVSSYWCESSSSYRSATSRSRSTSGASSHTAVVDTETGIGAFWTGVGWFLVGAGWLFWGGETYFIILPFHSSMSF
jgi:hypothetical protein